MFSSGTDNALESFLDLSLLFSMSRIFERRFWFDLLLEVKVPRTLPSNSNQILFNISLSEVPFSSIINALRLPLVIACLRRFSYSNFLLISRTV